MNTSQFMDKQIMDLSAGSQSNDFINLMSPEDDHLTGVGGGGGGGGGGGSKKEEIVPSYDFQPIRPMGSSQFSNLDAVGGAGGPRAWSSTDSKTNTPGIRNYGSLDSNELSKISLEKDRNIDAAIVSEIDRTMKKHADNLLHALEGLSARLTQLESRTRNLENSVDDLKVSVGNNHGSADGKMRQLENILREVQTGVQVLRDKQEIVEAHLQLAKLQVSKADQQSETQNTVTLDSAKQAASPPQQSHQPLPPPVTPQTLPALPPPNAPPPPPQLNMQSPPAQLPSQFPPNQIPSIPQREPYFQPPGQAQEAPNQQYQLPPTQQPQPPPAAPSHQQYQPASLPQYSQPPQLPQQHPSIAPINPPPQHQPPLGHHPEETSYVPPQTYPPSLRQPPSQPLSGAPPSQQFYGPPSHMYEAPSGRSSSGFSTGFVPPPSGPTEPYSYSGSPSQYGSNMPMKPQQFSSGVQGGGSGYPQLPTARVLPHALPTASGPVGGSGPGSGSGSSGSGNRVPIDDVVDKVTNMGFPRDLVRATVRKLTENGQSVDLNVVLDKLMNDGEVQPPRGWFGR